MYDAFPDERSDLGRRVAWPDVMPERATVEVAEGEGSTIRRNQQGGVRRAPNPL